MDTALFESALASAMAPLVPVTQAETVLSPDNYAAVIISTTDTPHGDTIMSVAVQGIGPAPDAATLSAIREHLAVTSDINRDFSADSDQDETWALLFECVNPVSL